MSFGIKTSALSKFFSGFYSRWRLIKFTSIARAYYFPAQNLQEIPTMQCEKRQVNVQLTRARLCVVMFQMEYGRLQEQSSE